MKLEDIVGVCDFWSVSFDFGIFHFSIFIFSQNSIYFIIIFFSFPKKDPPRPGSLAAIEKSRSYSAIPNLWPNKQRTLLQSVQMQRRDSYNRVNLLSTGSPKATRYEIFKEK